MEADRQIIRLWYKWQSIEDSFAEVSIVRPKNFNIDDLAVNLENIERAVKIVPSNKFAREAQKLVVNQITPDLTDKDYEEIDKELNAGSSALDPGDEEPAPCPQGSKSVQ